MNWTKEDDQNTIVGILVLVLSFILVRSCGPSQSPERPTSPPESFYTPGG